MMGNRIQTWLVALAASGLAVGCGQTSASRNSAPDPLFLSKRPVPGKFDAKAPTLAVADAPLPPAVPTTALAEGGDKVSAPDANANAQDGKTREDKFIPATPVSRPKPSGESKPVSETSPSTSLMYGHAADYSWIRGVLDKHYRSAMNIRYCDLSEEDAHGGKFVLEDDQSLASYRDGDIVWIEGELVPMRKGAESSPWERFRTYRIHTIRLEQRPQ
jgi:hypothetical protein